MEITGSVEVFWLESFNYTTSQIHAGVKKKKKTKSLSYIDYYAIKFRISGEKNEMVSIYASWLEFKSLFKKIITRSFIKD